MKHAKNFPVKGEILAVFLHSAKCRSSNSNFLSRSIFKCHADSSKVWKESSFSFVVRMAYVVTNHRAFSSKSTFSCHIDILKIFREFYIKQAKETLN